MTNANQPQIAKIIQEVQKAVQGCDEVIRLCVVALLADGHVLLEDAPGLGKTTLARAFSVALGCTFHRIQFTPDLLPGDVLGGSIYRQDSGDFEFRPGPIFTQLLLADEINRTTPRMQSALLEGMSERQVSLEGTTHHLPQPFFVVATQNPWDSEGTFPLPESQLDRFMMCLSMGYPDRSAELQIIQDHRDDQPLENLQAVVNADAVLQLQQQTRAVRVDESLAKWMLEIAHATRNHPEVKLGVSTRGVLTLYRAAQSFALVNGRDFVIPDDVQALVIPVLAHRLVSRGAATEDQRELASAVLKEIMSGLAVPV